MDFVLLFLSAIALDLLFGDPAWYPHPVRLIGTLCQYCEKLYRRVLPSRLRLAGLAAVLSVLIITAAVVFSLLFICHLIDSRLEALCAVLLLYASVAIRDLLHHSRRVYDVLIGGDLDEARKRVSMIVGRDTAALDEAGVERACVETVAENMGDGIIAPIFWAVVFAVTYGVSLEMPSFLNLSPISWAALGAWLYKACNTMDSMYGYKNERYIDFGRYAAYLDDLMNYIPARIAALSLIVATVPLRLRTLDAARIFWRDRLAHSSPNAGHPEAAMAGALGIILGGPSVYFGTVVKKPTMGDDFRPIETKDIVRANRMVFTGTIFFVTVLLAVYTQLTVFFVN